MKKEIQILLTAIMFYTRIPCPKWVDHSAHMLNQATRYFPLIGWIVGGSTAVVFYALTYVVTPAIALIFSMIASILLTGAFHEDGFADVCDGFGGGWTKDRILKIMKDSAIGAYGAIGIILMLLLKFLLLSELSMRHTTIFVSISLLAGHSISRLNAVWMIFSDTYARENDDAKAKPVAKKMNVSTLLAAMIFGLSPLILFQSFWILMCLLPLILVKLYLSRYFNKWIDGYTGDCLGAVQQTSEVCFYLSVMILWKYI